MKHLSEALSKSRIKQIKSRRGEFDRYSKEDLSNGDLLVCSDEMRIWMYLDGAEIEKRKDELLSPDSIDKNGLKNGQGFLVNANSDDKFTKTWGMFRIPLNITILVNDQLIYSNKTFVKLIKCGDIYLDKNLTIAEIYQKNDNFKEYKKI